MAQHDYVIANGTGAAVRSDLNNGLAAIVSNNSGATEPATMYAYQWWADTTTGLLKIRNAANNAWVTVGTLASANLGLLSSGSTITAALGSASTPGITFTGDTNTGIYSPGADQVAVATSGTGRLFVDASGNVSVGTYAASDAALTLSRSGNSYLFFHDATSSALDSAIGNVGGSIVFRNGANAGTVADLTERARIDSSGRLLVGATTFGVTGKLSVKQSADTAYSGLWIESSANDFGVGLYYSSTSDCFTLSPSYGTTGSFKGMAFLTSNAERMRITTAGAICFTRTSETNSSVGASIGSDGLTQIAASAQRPLILNRLANDGDLIVFNQDNTTEGSISVSGTTVSYNGAHLSRWSQLPGGTERTEILRGTVLSNIDEMCNWGEEENEQLNRMQVSDVEGDPNVSGVFQAWDDDDDTYTDDFYCAMTGDFIIRIAEGIPVHRGQLLMSAGDGTAIPQDDDIVRSKTIAKVISHHVTCTYDDGSYCVPCVLMAC